MRLLPDSSRAPKNLASATPEIPFEEKTLFLGLGPGKTGTTWLYYYLDGHPEFRASPIKELHFFSALHHSRSPQLYDKRALEKIQELVADPLLLTKPKAKRALQHYAERLRMTDEPNGYLDFFRRRVRPEHLAFGELSPSYCALSPDGFRFIREIHGKVRVLICLRDPLSRVDAVLRHMRKHGKDVSYDQFVARLKPGHRSHNLNYAELLDNIFAVFPEEEVHVQFFEEMFNQPAIDRITDFIGISHHPGDFEVRPAQSPPGPAPNDEHRARLLEILAPVYAACRARFGDRIPPEWIM